MFFIGIFGIDTKEKKIKNTSFYCKNCNRDEVGYLRKTYNYFHFFFIPIFKWNEKYYLLCSNCNAYYEISKEKGKEFEQREDSNISYWDIKEMKKHNIKRFCEFCNEEVGDNFNYCPYCGKELE